MATGTRVQQASDGNSILNNKIGRRREQTDELIQKKAITKIDTTAALNPVCCDDSKALTNKH